MGVGAIRGLVRRVVSTLGVNGALQGLDTLKHLSAKGLIRDMLDRGVLGSIQDAEFKVYSQWGDDGIIQYLINNVDIPKKARAFVEFGVENYTEANTRFLLTNDNWSGLVMDSDPTNIEHIKKEAIYWRHDLTALQSFVNAENINGLLQGNGFTGETGLLHIDIDGNDYWVWKGITAISPIIAIIEYNSLFGANRAVTIPYDPAFQRTKAHYSNLYCGASLKALCSLADEKGYHFVGTNSNGNNAYFVRKDKIGVLKPLTAEEGYVESRFRESRDPEGNLTFIGGDARYKVIEDLDVFDVAEDRLVKLRDCL